MSAILIPSAAHQAYCINFHSTPDQITSQRVAAMDETPQKMFDLAWTMQLHSLSQTRWSAVVLLPCPSLLLPLPRIASLLTLYALLTLNCHFLLKCQIRRFTFPWKTSTDRIISESSSQKVSLTNSSSHQEPVTHLLIYKRKQIGSSRSHGMPWEDREEAMDHPIFLGYYHPQVSTPSWEVDPLEYFTKYMTFETSALHQALNYWRNILVWGHRHIGNLYLYTLYR